jgi:hypothetical protein
MWGADGSPISSREPISNSARRRQSRQIVLPILVGLISIVVGAAAIEGFIWGLGLGIRIAIGLSIVEGLLFALLWFVILSWSPARLWRTDDGFAFRARRLAGGLFRSSEIRMRSIDVDRVAKLGKLNIVLAGAATVTRDGHAIRSYYEQIIVDRGVAGELGFETNNIAPASKQPDTWTTYSVRDIGSYQRRVGQVLALTGGAITITGILAIAASRDAPSIQVVLLGVLVFGVSLVVLGIAVGLVGAVRAAKGLKD